MIVGRTRLIVIIIKFNICGSANQRRFKRTCADFNKLKSISQYMQLKIRANQGHGEAGKFKQKIEITMIGISCNFYLRQNEVT